MKLFSQSYSAITLVSWSRPVLPTSKGTPSAGALNTRVWGIYVPMSLSGLERWDVVKFLRRISLITLVPFHLERTNSAGNTCEGKACNDRIGVVTYITFMFYKHLGDWLYFFTFYLYVTFLSVCSWSALPGGPAGFQARVGKIRRKAPKINFFFAHPG